MNREENKPQLDACCSPAVVTINNTTEDNPCCFYATDGTKYKKVNESIDVNADKSACC